MTRTTKQEKLRDRAAKALDTTHAIADRGPVTMLARQRLAEWLDLGWGCSQRQVIADCVWLESHA